MEPNLWHVLDVGSIWMKEFASALGKQAPVIAWSPVMSRLGVLHDWEYTERMDDPPLEVHHYPLQRGYAHELVSEIFPFEDKLLKRLLLLSHDPLRSVLICSTPFYAPVAEKWPGPVSYYVTDLTIGYDGIKPSQVVELDRRLCCVARSVCPNSTRIADYLIRDAACDKSKITIVPNATREMNVAAQPLGQPQALPAEIADLPRPIVGVIGNLAANMDWELLAEAISQTAGFSWIFVGPTKMPIRSDVQSRARSWVMQHARFIGSRPYGELQAYARSFDVAVLPYRRHEPTYSGSSTRFYEHLAACRPMIATRGFAELLEKQPLVELVDTANELSAALMRLRENGFSDGLESARWQASKAATWEERARTLAGTIQNISGDAGLGAI